MGCGGSKEAGSAVELQTRPRQSKKKRQPPQQQEAGFRNLSKPSVMVPPQYRDATGQLVQHASFTLDRDTIHSALDSMAAYMAQQGVSISVVTVGGAVNTLYLQSRETTHDIDFFMSEDHAPEHHVIHQAAKLANRQLGGSLGAEWFNNATQLLMPGGVQQELVAAAFEQNAIVYERVDRRGGLRIYAAPWSYAFCGKLNRLSSNTEPPPYDLPDAVVYLREYLRAHGRQTVNKDEIYSWCKRYGKRVSSGVLERVNDAYQRKYGARPIIV